MEDLEVESVSSGLELERIDGDNGIGEGGEDGGQIIQLRTAEQQLQLRRLERAALDDALDVVGPQLRLHQTLVADGSVARTQQPHRTLFRNQFAGYFVHFQLHLINQFQFFFFKLIYSFYQFFI